MERADSNTGDLDTRSKIRGIYSPRSGWTIYSDGKQITGYFANAIARRLSQRSKRWAKLVENNIDNEINNGPKDHVIHLTEYKDTKVEITGYYDDIDNIGNNNEIEEKGDYAVGEHNTDDDIDNELLEDSDEIGGGQRHRLSDAHFTIVFITPRLKTADIVSSFDEAVNRIKGFLDRDEELELTIDKKEVLRVFENEPVMSPRYKEWCWCPQDVNEKNYRISIISPR